MRAFSNARRNFLKHSVYLGTAIVASGPLSKVIAVKPAGAVSKMKLAKEKARAIALISPCP